MRQDFPGWFQKTQEELAAIWDHAIFVPDANILLHCVRHPTNVREELLRVFEVLKDSLWIPYQVGLEFNRNRLDVEFGAQDAYDRLTKEYEGALGQAKERLRQLRAHPMINVEHEIAALDGFLDDFKTRIAEARLAHPAGEIALAVNRLTDLFKDRVGPKWKHEQLIAIKKEGEDRYAKQIPPGYKDAKKDAGEFNRFGDLIIWKDMLEKAKSENRPIIFISDDAKEDWWWIHRGRKLGARPELIEEFKLASDQDFHVYEFGQFLRIAAERHPEIQAGVEQISKSLSDDEQARKRARGAAEIQSLKELITRLEDERDSIVSALSGAPTIEPIKTLVKDKTALRERLTMLGAELDDAVAALTVETDVTDSGDLPS
ncbi:hypothetical protein SAMN05444172_0026 [Burkholderia sp. GAS332]|nr:hypothetical protein SAMN05444172_0026 [Burkholderia sp. GAS332]